jgi:hypothetical protein
VLPPDEEERGWGCPACDSESVEILGPFAPDAWPAAAEGERLEAERTQDICILPFNGGLRYFIRGHIQLPVRGSATLRLFIWSVWVEVDEETMRVIARSWNHPNRAGTARLSGRLATELPYEQPTRDMPVTIITRDPGLPPVLLLNRHCGHTLAWEQYEFITQERVIEFTRLLERANS